LTSPTGNVQEHDRRPRVAAVIPCFRVKRHVSGVIDSLAGYVDHVFVVDDCCPEQSGDHVEATANPEFVTVLRHSVNQGVGGAVLTGYRRALEEAYSIVVKVDGDGQMDPSYIPALIQPILDGKADYTKGNRFFDLATLTAMPRVRVFGNAVLSFVTKLSSGYWDLMDPTNGFTAIHCSILKLLPVEKMEKRYFFESDMLFRLGCIRAVVLDIPMPSKYGDEKSNLHVGRAAIDFPTKHLARILKRLFYSYFLRGFSAGTLLLCAGLPLLIFGTVYGTVHWIASAQSGQPAAAGVVMLAALPVILGLQLLLSFLSLDIGNTPTRPIWPLIHPLPLAPTAEDRIDQPPATAGRRASSEATELLLHPGRR